MNRIYSQNVKDTEAVTHTIHGKMEKDRIYAQQIVDRTVAELVQDLSFHSLFNAVREAKKTMVDEENQVTNYWQNKLDIKRLKVEIKNVSTDVAVEAERFKMALWSLQDNLQEHNIRCELENKYIARVCDMRINKSKKFCNNQELQVQDQLTDLKKQCNLEVTVHRSMVKIIEKMKAEAQAKLEHWLEKYETDKETITRTLDNLKQERAQCLDRIAWLNSMIDNYKPIVKDDRRVKKLETDRTAMMELMGQRATRIQAWWRGTMVRKGLGPFNPKNIKKAGKAKKTGKGKKKK